MTTRPALPSVHTLGPERFPELWPVLAEEAPVAASVAAGIREELRSPFGLRSRFLSTSTPAESLIYVGNGVVPLRLAPEDADAFAASLVVEGCARTSVHGYRDLVEPLWCRLSSQWGPEREFRDAQLLLRGSDLSVLGRLVRDRPPGCGPIRRAAVSEFSRVLPAAAAMYREELGTDPLEAPYAEGYRRRVAGNLRRGLTWVCDVDGAIAFKLDVVAREFGVAVIQGVWTDPALRGRGIATYGFAAVMGLVHARGLVPTLVVNADNLAARVVYRRCGMDEAADYATVVF